MQSNDEACAETGGVAVKVRDFSRVICGLAVCRERFEVEA
jgi:hypothetical protein